MSYSRQELAALGKRASDLHRQQGVDLTDAVIKVASTEPRLTDEHITRITENANLVTFEENFKAGESKHVVFDLADPQEVIHSRSPEMDKVSSLYDFPPNYGEHGDIFDTFDAEYRGANINPEFESNKEITKLSHSYRHIESEMLRTDSEAERALYALTSMIKKAALSHGSLYGPLQVIGEVAEMPDIFQKVASVAVEMMPDLPRGSYEPLVPNLNHPLARQYVRVEMLTKEAGILREQMEELSINRDKAISLKKIHGDIS